MCVDSERSTQCGGQLAGDGESNTEAVVICGGGRTAMETPEGVFTIGHTGALIGDPEPCRLAFGPGAYLDPPPRRSMAKAVGHQVGDDLSDRIPVPNGYGVAQHRPERMAGANNSGLLLAGNLLEIYRLGPECPRGYLRVCQPLDLTHEAPQADHLGTDGGHLVGLKRDEPVFDRLEASLRQGERGPQLMREVLCELETGRALSPKIAGEAVKGHGDVADLARSLLGDRLSGVSARECGSKDSEALQRSGKAPGRKEAHRRGKQCRPHRSEQVDDIEMGRDLVGGGLGVRPVEHEDVEDATGKRARHQGGGGVRSLRKARGLEHRLPVRVP